MSMHKSNLKNAFFALLLIFTLTTLTNSTHAAGLSQFQIGANLTREGLNKKDTIPANKPATRLGNLRSSTAANDSGSRADTVIVPTTDTFQLKFSKDTLSAPVNYEAEDSVVVLIEEKKIILYGKTRTAYEDVILNAPKVEIDQQTSIVTAVYETDSLGRVITRAQFEQGMNRFESDTIQFNFKTQRGITKNTITKQDEFFIHGARIKKVDESTVFIAGGRFTTCNLDEPHFDFFSNRMKVVNNKVAVTGYVQLEFEDVPIPKPFGLPFGIFPLERGRHSGLLPPQFTTTEEFGLGLEGLGYYKVLNDNLDVILQGNIYSYGGWSASLMPSYRKRYRYQGGLRFSVQNTKFNFRGDPDYERQRQFNIGWSHTMDARARPGVNFSASVNAGSTQFNKYQTIDPRKNFQNQMYSTISFSKSWRDKPFNLTLNASHQQNAQTRQVNLTLPDASFTVNTIYPFSPADRIGSPKWYEKLGLGYRGTFRNQINFNEEDISAQKLLDTLQWGAIHSIPISLSLPPMGPIMVSPGISFEEQWIMRKSYKRWNDVAKRVDTTNEKGFFTTRYVSMALSFNTALFGTYQFRNSALRHVIRPSISMNYSPNLQKNNYYTIQVDTTGRKLEFPVFVNGPNYANQRFGGFGFQVDNNLEMKRRKKADTTNAEVQPMRLIDGFGFSSNYNFFADSLKLGVFNLYLRSTLFEKINLTANAYMNPYQEDKYGRPVDELMISSGKLGRITGASLSMSTSFTSKPRDPSKAPASRQGPVVTDPTLMGDQQQMQEYMRRNPNEFVDFNIPWDIGIDFHLSYTTQPRTDFSGFDKTFNTSFTFRNSFSLTPKWNFSTNGYFNVDQTKLEQFTMSINRDLHCWQMGINVTPVGLYSSFSITVSPKSSVLQDLKVNRTRVFSNF